MNIEAMSNLASALLFLRFNFKILDYKVRRIKNGKKRC